MYAGELDVPSPRSWFFGKVKSMLEEAGFEVSDVDIASDDKVYAKGRWLKESCDVLLPSRVKRVWPI
jgi:hypothetical protein